MFEERDYTYIVLEYCDGGDLGTYLSQHAPLEEYRIGYFAASIGSCNAVVD